jgi:ribulose-phosphate 3-epimerase
MNPIISASILSAEFSNLKHTLDLCEQAGIDWIHVDVMDGHFVPNLTMGPFIVEAVKKNTSLPIDCHLMVEHPETLVHSFADAGANVITIHPENNPNVHRTLQLIKSLGCKPGVAINPGTPSSMVTGLIPFVDLVLVMTVNPGFSGQKFIPEMTQKIIEISKSSNAGSHNPMIEVDGGINAETLPYTMRAGANVFVAATSIFKFEGGIAEGVKSLRDAMLK